MMKKAIFFCALMVLLLSGCTGKTDETDFDDLMEPDPDYILELLDELAAARDAEFQRMQDRWDLHESFNQSCISDKCQQKCEEGTYLHESFYDPTDFDYNEDGELDPFETEIMNSQLERVRDCIKSCISIDSYQWRKMDECRDTDTFNTTVEICDCSLDSCQCED